MPFGLRRLGGAENRLTGPGLVPAQVWFQPAAVVSLPQSTWDPQHQADSCDANRAGGSSKHMERRHRPSAFMEKTQPSQSRARTEPAPAAAPAWLVQSPGKFRSTSGRKCRERPESISSSRCSRYLSLIAQARWGPTRRRNPTAPRRVGFPGRAST